MSPLWKYHELVENVTIGTTNGTTFSAKVGTITCIALIDAGPTRSVMSEKYYQTLMLPQMKHLYNVPVRSASGSNLQSLRLGNCSFYLGSQVFTFDFFVCKNLTRHLIFGLDFFRSNKIGIDWSPKGDLNLSCAQQILIESMDISIEGSKIYIKHDVNIPTRTLAILDIGVDVQRKDLGQLYDIKPKYMLPNETQIQLQYPQYVGASEPPVAQTFYPENNKIPSDKETPESVAAATVPFVVVNLAIDDICLGK